jgi:uncharacterized protein
LAWYCWQPYTLPVAGLGASGAFKSVIIATVDKVAPQHAENTAFYQDFAVTNPEGPWKNFLVFEVIGVLIGAFFRAFLPTAQV